jgi:hypothetical protein
MERAASSMLATRTVEPPAMEAPARRGWIRRLVAGFCDSCALAVMALLACLAVVAVGTVGSLIWMFLLER